jgi:hypothetical protein
MVRLRIPIRLAAGAAALAIAGSVSTPALAQPPFGNGRIVGHVTKHTGEPVGSGFVIAYEATTQVSRAFGNIDAAGAYTLQGLPAGTYKVQYFTVLQQWAHRKTSFETADVFTVVDGQDTVVDEVLFPTGSVTVTASDQVTHAPIAHFCADLSGSTVIRHDCTETGTVTLTDVPPGQGYFLITTGFDDRYFTHEGPLVDVVAEQTTAVHIEMEPMALITTTIEDAVTHTPVANACVFPVTGIGGFGHFAFDCSGPDGRVTITGMHTAPYQLYVFARDGVHGDQWVGRHGGTGYRLLARTVNTTGGQTMSIPPIRLDPAGSISGMVVDKATGVPVEGVCAFTHAGGTTGGPDQAPYCTGPDGKYTISGVGPYLWPVQFIDTIGHRAWQWSGDRPTQFSAQPVPVRAGQTTPLDAHLAAGATITGRITTTAGQPMTRGFLFAYNALTGDPVANYGLADENGNYQVDGIAGPQLIRINYDEGFAVGGRTGWYRSATSFGSANPLLVRPGGVRTGIDIVVPAA